MSTRDKLKEIIRELIRQELEEVSVTGAIDGGEGPPRTPYAFSGKKKKDKKKRKKIATTSTGYELVSEEITDKDLRKISDIIRMEVALIFFDLFKKKALWT